MPAAWSREEVDAAVSDYFDMLVHELRQEPFSKAEHRRRLVGKLHDRTEKSVERKHSNISAVLIQLGYPFIQGYKPLSNYQGLLAQVVAERLESAAGLTSAVKASVEAPASAPRVTDYLIRLESPPPPMEMAQPVSRDVAAMLDRVRPPVNYLEREARNSLLGRAGEEFAVAFERARLRQLGADRLVDRVEHVAATRGDGLGFDVRSFNADGSDRFIEVKTTAYGKQTPFFVTRNELFVSKSHAREFQLYRLFDFRTDPRLYTVAGPIDQACTLDPVQYAARMK